MATQLGNFGAETDEKLCQRVEDHQAKIFGGAHPCSLSMIPWPCEIPFPRTMLGWWTVDLFHVPIGRWRNNIWMNFLWRAGWCTLESPPPPTHTFSDARGKMMWWSQTSCSSRGCQTSTSESPVVRGHERKETALGWNTSASMGVVTKKLGGKFLWDIKLLAFHLKLVNGDCVVTLKFAMPNQIWGQFNMFMASLNMINMSGSRSFSLPLLVRIQQLQMMLSAKVTSQMNQRKTVLCEIDHFCWIMQLSPTKKAKNRFLSATKQIWNTTCRTVKHKHNFVNWFEAPYLRVSSQIIRCWKVKSTRFLQNEMYSCEHVVSREFSWFCKWTPFVVDLPQKFSCCWILTRSLIG